VQVLGEIDVAEAGAGGVTVTRGERATRTREAIIDAAAEVFDRNGYPGAGLAEILRTAGVTKGALYFHFASKEQLARAIIDQQFASGPAVDTAPPAGTAVQALIDLTYTFARQLVEQVRVRAAIRLVIEHASFTAPLPDPYLEWIRMVRGLLERARDAGELRPDVDPGALAQLVVGAFTGVQLTSEVLAGRRDLPERLADLWQALLPGIVPAERLATLRVRPIPIS
jgi:AcrR family transcriptional regulator